MTYKKIGEQLWICLITLLVMMTGLQPVRVEAKPTALDVPMTELSVPAAQADYQQLVTYLEQFDQIDRVVSADILANFNPAVSVERFRDKDFKELYPGEELWRYTYATVDQQTGQDSQMSIGLLFYENKLLTAMLYSLDAYQLSSQPLGNFEHLSDLVEAHYPVALQGLVFYRGKEIRHLIVPQADENAYLLYVDGELIESFRKPRHPDEPTKDWVQSIEMIADYLEKAQLEKAS